MWGWIAEGLGPAAGGAARTAAAVLLTVAAVAASPGAEAAAAPVTFTVPGGKVRILDVPRAARDTRDAIVLTVSEELSTQTEHPLLDIDRARCPSGEVLITLEKQATLQRRWAAGSTDEKALGGVLVPGAPCRIWLNARAVRRLDQARICNLVRHELGHARGLDHATSGLMAPVIPLLPVRGCDWAESTWLTDAT